MSLKIGDKDIVKLAIGNNVFSSVDHEFDNTDYDLYDLFTTSDLSGLVTSDNVANDILGKKVVLFICFGYADDTGNYPFLTVTKPSTISNNINVETISGDGSVNIKADENNSVVFSCDAWKQDLSAWSNITLLKSVLVIKLSS